MTTEPSQPTPSADSEVLERGLRSLLEATGRERKRLLKEWLPRLGREHVDRVAPLVRDPSPRVSSRVTAFLARQQAEGPFRRALEGLKPGKIALLEAAFRRQREGGSREGE